MRLIQSSASQGLWYHQLFEVDSVVGLTLGQSIGPAGKATAALASAHLNHERHNYLGSILVGFLAFLVGVPAVAQNGSAVFSSLASEADAARVANDLPRAIQLYGQALQMNPEWKQGWWYLGLLEYQADSYSAARDALTHYINLDPNTGPAYALRGLCEFETGEYGSSLQDIERGLSLGAANQLRNEQILRYHEALLLARSGRFQDALGAYAWFARKGITSPELMEQIGLAGLRTATLPTDAADKQKSLVMAAGHAAFQYMAGQESEANASFHELFQQFPTAANAHLLYGYLLFQQSPAEATDEFKRELEVAPSSSAARVMLAWAYLMQSDPSTALPYAERAEQEEPSLPAAQLVLGRSLVQTGKVNDGTHYLEKARQLDPGNPEVHIALAEAYSETGRKEDARRERLESLRLTNASAPPLATP
ncbi:MAG TPA: tetratricopeptide repeat protein [Candidatus Acidoferrum sp.]|nr:tetratricopeptide repeat protein [Candidatus Acidoferrum sp.]